MKPTQKEIYDCAVKREKIKNNTTRKRFLEAIASELIELGDTRNCITNLELADVVLVCYSMAEHYGYNLDEAIKAKHQYNLKRKD